MKKFIVFVVISVSLVSFGHKSENAEVGNWDRIDSISVGWVSGEMEYLALPGLAFPSVSDIDGYAVGVENYFTANTSIHIQMTHLEYGKIFDEGKTKVRGLGNVDDQYDIDGSLTIQSLFVRGYVPIHISYGDNKPIERLRGYGEIGGSFVMSDISVNGINLDDNFFSMSYGLGLEVRLHKQAHIDFNFTQYATESLSNGSFGGFNMAAKYRF